MTNATLPKRSLMDRFLTIVERGGNALPHPATLFALLALGVVVASWLASMAGLSVAHPSTGELVTPVSLLTIDGLHRMMTGAGHQLHRLRAAGDGAGGADRHRRRRVSGFIGALLRCWCWRAAGSACSRRSWCSPA